MSHYSEQDRERPIGIYGTTNVPKVAVGIWTAADKQMMVKAVQEEGLDYEALAALIKTKSPDDCVAFTELVFKSLGHQFAQALLRTTRKRDSLGSLSRLVERVMSTQFEADMIELLELEPECAFNTMVVQYAGKSGKKTATVKQEPSLAKSSSSTAAPPKKSHKKKVPSVPEPSHVQPSSSCAAPPKKSHKKKTVVAPSVVTPSDERTESLFEKPATRGSAGITRPRETFSPPISPTRSTTSSRGRGGRGAGRGGDTRGRGAQRGRGSRGCPRGDNKSSDPPTDTESKSPGRRGRKTAAPHKLKTEVDQDPPQPKKPQAKRPPPTPMAVEVDAHTDLYDEAEVQVSMARAGGQGKRSRDRPVAEEISSTLSAPHAGASCGSPATQLATRAAPAQERAARTQPLLVRGGSIAEPPAWSHADRRSPGPVEQSQVRPISQTESFLAQLLSQQDMQDETPPTPVDVGAYQQQHQQWHQHSDQPQPGQQMQQREQLHPGQQVHFTLPLAPAPPIPVHAFPPQYQAKPSPRLAETNPSRFYSETQAPVPKRQKAEASSAPRSFAKPQGEPPAVARGAVPTDHDVKPDLSYIGVSYRAGSFYTKIKLDGQTKTFGPYKTDLEAAHAYDSLARAHRGSRARCNFNEDGSRNPPSMPSKRNRSRPQQAESQGYSPMETQCQSSSGGSQTDSGGHAYAMPSPARFPSMSPLGYQAQESQQDDDYYEDDSTQMEWADDGDNAWVSFS